MKISTFPFALSEVEGLRDGFHTVWLSEASAFSMQKRGLRKMLL
jgi:hypothetical protein